MDTSLLSKEMAGAGYKNPDQLAELSLMAQNTKGFNADLAKDYITASDAAYHDRIDFF